jgi:hypothetical protein
MPAPLRCLIWFQDVDTFVYEISRDKSGDERQKLMDLQLTEEEWIRVEKFIHVLRVCVVFLQYSCAYRDGLHLERRESSACVLGG